MPNTLFLNPLDGSGTIFFEDRIEEYISYQFWGEFAEKFPSFLADLMKQYNFEQLWCINWPYQFTQIRIFTLSVNALKLLFPSLILKKASFFEFLEGTAEQNSIPLIEANKKEFLVHIHNGNVFFQKEDLPWGNYTGYASEKDFTDGKHFIQYTFRKEEITAFFSKRADILFMEPLYIKKPHITCQKP